MSTATPAEDTLLDAPTPTTAGGHGHDGHGHDDGHHEHPDYVAHHFDSSQQQFDAGKLGIWLFLSQEVLFFSGLFCFYAYFKTLHPEAFSYAHKFLDIKYGAINTVVLITSSLTMAWGVRCAQLNQKNGLKVCVGLTILGAFVFLGIKYVEYSHKLHYDLKPAGWYNFHAFVEEAGDEETALRIFNHEIEDPTSYGHHGDGHAGDHASGDLHDDDLATGVDHSEPGHSDGDHAEEADGNPEGPRVTDTVNNSRDRDAASPDEQSEPADMVVEDVSSPRVAGKGTAAESLEERQMEARAAYEKGLSPYNRPEEAGVYFSLYYAMTGLHAIHIIAGIAVLGWIFVRALREDFHSDYFGPVDYVGLYWHLVDLIWIFLFPMLYLFR